MGIRVLGTGGYIPPRILDNEFFTTIVDTSCEWIEKRTGILQRHVMPDDMNSLDMAKMAAERALENAGVDAKDLKAVICATLTQDELTPSLSCSLLTEIGAQCMAFDVNAACSGFLYLLKIADALCEKEEGPMLLLGVEALSKIINYEDRATCVLFGDAAGGMVVQRGNELQHIEVHAYGDPDRVLRVGGINQGKRITGTAQPSLTTMKGQEVFKFATREMEKVMTSALESTGLSSEDISLVIPHQANLRIIKYAAQRMKIPYEKFYVNIQHTGNTSAASIPYALYEADQKGLIHRGDHVMLVGFGGGLTSGCAVFTWQKDK